MMPGEIKVEFHVSVYFNDEDDIFPYISVENPERDIVDLISPNQIVISMKEIRIEYDYALNRRTIKFFKADNEAGFTRIELARKICEGYQEESRDLLLHTVQQIEGNLFGLTFDS